MGWWVDEKGKVSHSSHPNARQSELSAYMVAAERARRRAEFFVNRAKQAVEWYEDRTRRVRELSEK